MALPELIYALEFVGILAFAISGMLEAQNRDMDPVGVFAIACITAFGGGTLRDVILDHQPVYWISHQEFPIIILLLTLGFSYIPKLRAIPARFMVLPDAIGLGIFTVLGTQLALKMGVPVFSACLLGVITGTFGGLARDIICNEVPFIFRKEHLYASCALAGALTFWMLTFWFTTDAVPILGGMSVTVLMRLLSVYFDLRLQRH
ncbi:trimeric intracellular cation channel family protein [Salinispirillum marinum]|uniref:Trimeric intracellular cation channel family protein n=2 Tax=Saccharospirillaceae TaxID=255527 RepID=A0ABV8BHJ1_9GAMM